MEKPNLMKDSDYDVLSWWKRNSPKYPILSLVAKDILAVQVSSVASESAFSTSGRVLDPSRSCLTHYMIEVLMCTEQWLKCEIHMNEKGVFTIEQLLAVVKDQYDLMRGKQLNSSLILISAFSFKCLTREFYVFCCGVEFEPDFNNHGA